MNVLGSWMGRLYGSRAGSKLLLRSSSVILGGGLGVNAHAGSVTGLNGGDGVGVRFSSQRIDEDEKIVVTDDSDSGVVVKLAREDEGKEKEWEFEYQGSINWYPGHMAKAMRKLESKMERVVDAVIQVADARLPVSSVGFDGAGIDFGDEIEEFDGDDDGDDGDDEKVDGKGASDSGEGSGGYVSRREIKSAATRSAHGSLLDGLPRVLVFNKTDLSNSNLQSRVKALYPNQPLFFTSLTASKQSKGWKSLKGIVPALIKQLPEGSKPKGGEFYNILVVGLPNVGKSSLINALRAVHTGSGKKVLTTGPKPGVTRHVTPIGVKVSDKPRAYMMDSPGLMFPRIPSSDVGFKLGLIAALPDHIVSPELLVEYVLARAATPGGGGLSGVAAAAAKRYKFDSSELPTDVDEFLEAIAGRVGARVKGGGVDRDRASSVFLTDLRSGKLGPWTLDHLAPPKTRIPVTLYTKPACTLCHPVARALDRLQESREFSESVKIGSVNIEEDDAAWEAYKYDIPVVHVGEPPLKKLMHKITYTDVAEAVREALEKRR